MTKSPYFSAFLLIFLSSQAMADLNLGITKIEANDVTNGLRHYSINLCMKDSIEMPLVQRPNEKGELKAFKLRPNRYACYLLDDQLSVEPGWRTVCYRVTQGQQSRVIRLFMNPTDSTFVSGFDSAELTEEGIVNTILPDLNTNKANNYESALCPNLTM